MSAKPRYRRFHLKIVPDGRPDSDGQWIERVVPDEWPGDDKAQSHMLKTVPDYDTVPLKGFQIVNIREATPGPSNQPGFMWQAPDPDYRDHKEEMPEESDQPSVPGM